MNLIQNMPLANTLGLASYAQYGCLLSHSDDVVAARAFAQAEGLPFRVIGAGSNIVPMAERASGERSMFSNNNNNNNNNNNPSCPVPSFLSYPQ